MTVYNYREISFNKKGLVNTPKVISGGEKHLLCWVRLNHYNSPQVSDLKGVLYES